MTAVVLFFKYNLFIYLFIFGSARSSLLCGLFSSCGLRASHCSGFSRCRIQALRARGLQ